ncbi:hypothetical protein ABZ743_09970 [Streptomyces sp. NPDC006662]
MKSLFVSFSIALVAFVAVMASAPADANSGSIETRSVAIVVNPEDPGWD